jgi:site-specific recombinase
VIAGVLANAAAHGLTVQAYVDARSREDSQHVRVAEEQCHRRIDLAHRHGRVLAAGPLVREFRLELERIGKERPTQQNDRPQREFRTDRASFERSAEALDARSD